MKLKDLVPDVWSGEELKPLNMYSAKDVKDAISAQKIVAKTVVIRNNSTGEIIGKRTIATK